MHCVRATTLVFAVAVSYAAAWADHGFRFDVAHPLARPAFRPLQEGLPGSVDRMRLLENVDAADTSNWAFGWFVFGETGSRSVTVGLRNGKQLFVDLDRDRQFSVDEMLERTDGAGTTWQTKIGAEFFTNDNDYFHYPRAVLLRLTASGQIEVATAGVMAGNALVGTERIRAVRVDRNSNGLWFDSHDRILLDKDRDGELHPIGERIACDAVCRIEGKRFVLQSDLPGERLELVELAGVGNLLPTVAMQGGVENGASKPPGAQINDVAGTIVSRSGVRVAIRALGEPVECPVGDYRVEDLKLEVSSGDGCFLYRFASFSSKEFPIKVVAGKTTECELLGELSFSVERTTQRDASGTLLTFVPMVESATGMYLQGCMKGAQAPTIENRLLLELHGDDRVVDRNSTGFS